MCWAGLRKLLLNDAFICYLVDGNYNHVHNNFSPYLIVFNINEYGAPLKTTKTIPLSQLDSKVMQSILALRRNGPRIGM